MMKKLLLNLLLLLTIAIGASAQTEVVIGNGTSTSYYTPYNSLWGYSFVEQIYTAEEIGMPGIITSISFNMRTSDASQTNTIDVFMKNVSRSNFADNTDYETVTASDLVFSGSVTFSPGWTTITLDTPFEYDGSSNLMIGMHEYTSGYSSRYFYYTSTTNSVISFHSDSADPNPYSLGSYSGTVYVKNERANIKLEINEAATSCPRPTALVASNVGTRTVDLSWTNGADETNWQICLNGDVDNLIDVTTNPYTLTGLTPETAYSIKVRANCGAEQSIWSNTVNITTAIACPAPTELDFSSISVNSVDVSWSAGASETLWNLQYKSAADSEWTEVNGLTSANYTITGLQSGTQYNVRVQADCEVESTSSWLTGNFTTAYGIPFLEEFPASTLPANWTKHTGILSDVMGGTAFSSNTGNWNFGQRNIWDSHTYVNVYGTSCKYWLVTPNIIMDSNVRLTFDLALTDYYNSNPIEDPTAQADDKFVVLITTDGGSSWTILRQYDNAGSEFVYNNIPTAGEEVAIDLSSYSTGSIKIAFYVESLASGGDNELHVDNVRLDYIPTCVRPTQLAVSNITSRTATVSWTPGADETSWQICLQDDEDDLITVTEPTYTLTDLGPESDYTVKVRSVCGEGDYSIWTSNRSFTTLIACPKPTALTISNITGHTATATWTSGASETSWLVCLDGDEDAAFEVTDTTYTITGLAPESDYSIKVRANCGGIDGVSAWTNEVWYTTTVACPAPTGLALAAYTPTSATLTWNAGEANSWLLMYGTDSEFGADTYTEVTVNDNPTVEITGLTPETVYYARVMAYCGVDEESDWSANLSFEPTAKIVIGSGTATNSYLPTHSNYRYSLTQQIYTAAEIGTSGYINSVDFYNAGTEKTRTLNVYIVPTTKTSFDSNTDWIVATADNMVFTGSVTFAAGVWNTIQFTEPIYYNGTANLALIVDDNTGSYSSGLSCRTFNATSQAIYFTSDSNNQNPEAPTASGSRPTYKNQIRLLVEAGDPPACVRPIALAVPTVTGHTATATWSAGADETSWQVCLSDDEDNLIDVTEPTYTFTGLAPESDYTVRVRSNCGDNGYSDWTSNIWFSTLVACPASTAIEASNIGLTTATLTWTAGGTETSWIVKYGAGQFDVETEGTEVTVETTPSVELTGLISNTLYRVYVKSICSDTEESVWTLGTFRTECGLQGIPYEETFEDYTSGIPACWTKLGTGTVAAQTTNPHNGTKSLKFSGATSNLVLLPTFEVELNTLQVSFWTRPESYTNASCGTFSVGYVTDIADANTFVAIETYSYNSFSAYDKKTIYMNEAPAGSILAMRHNPTSTVWYWFVDDINVDIIPSCIPPSAPVVSDITANTATFAWTAGADETAWQICINDDMDNLVDVTTNPFVITNLAANSDYSIKVRAYCDDADQSTWTEDVAFTTLPTCIVPTDLEVSNVTAHSATITWTAGASETAWQIVIDNDYQNIIDIENNPVYEMTNLAAESDYIVKVRAYCADDDQSDWVTTYVTTDISCPVPTALAASNVTATSATLSWTAGASETSWILQYGTDNTFADNTEITADAATVELSGLTAEVVYYARVKAVCGGIDGESQWSAVCSFNPSVATTIGTAESTSNYLPTYNFFKYTLTQQIYTAAEIGTAGTISSVAFYNAGAEKTRTLNVYVTMTDKSSFVSATDWEAVSSENLVYSGSVTFTPSVWTTITFSTPFDYDGVSNLLITVDDNTGAYTSSPHMSCNTFAATSQAIRYISDSDNQDPTAPTATGTVMNVKNQIRLLIDSTPTFTITATAGENGTITPSGAVTVTEGGEQAFTIEANNGFRILSVLVDGNEAINELVAGVYTFTNVTEDHTIAATFVSESAITYTINASAGEHGTITPSGAVSVVEGEDQSFVITPDTDYRIDVLTVDGNVVTLTDEECAGYTYTFTSVYGGHTINVTFTSLNNVEINAAASMAVYPNPNNGMFSIDFSNIEGEATYQLIDARGAVVETREINVTNGETKTFNHTLTAGTYFVRIINGDKVYVEQIVVE